MIVRFNPRLLFSRLTTLVLVAMFPGNDLAAEQSAAFEEEKRITAMDVVVDFHASGLREWAKDGPVPKRLRPEDFEVLFDGQPRTVVAVEPATGRWQTVIYFDAVLTNGADLRWAATALADTSAKLAALGEVTVIVADPAPRTLLSSTSDPERLHAALSQLAQTLEGQDELVTLRSEVLAELRREEPALTAQDLEAVVRGEGQRVGERNDDLMLTLVGHKAIGAHRLLLLASGGFDLDAGAFYGPLIEQLREVREKDPSTPPMIVDSDTDTVSTDTVSTDAVSTDTLAQTLAAYGWTTVALVPRRQAVLKPGIRIGKFRLSGPGIVFDEDENRTFFKFFSATFEEHRKPERAKAYLELGAALEGQGKFEEAEDAVRQAIYYFSGDPRTADQQAAAHVYLGKLLEAQNKTPQAIEAFERASRLDPEFTYEEVGHTAELMDPLAPLRTITRTTNGVTVRGARQLADTVDDLRRRVRVTYQVVGLPDGKLHSLEARYLGPPRELTHPVWARHSVPEAVAAARVRRLMAGEPTGGTWRLNATASPTAATGLALALDLESGTVQATDIEPAVLRLTVAIGGPDSEPQIEHHSLGVQSLADLDNWRHRMDLDNTENAPWLAVLVEDLASGAWGGRLIELP